MKKILAVILITYIVSRILVVRAEYVLPYPSFMPGNAMYRVSRVVDRLKYYWSWGNIARVKYHLALSDKYLVEAKTLFEYKQYLLAHDALTRSDREFMQISAYLSGAKKNIDISKFKQLMNAAAEKHEEILVHLLTITPQQFTWTPEKAASISLPLHNDIERSRILHQDVRNTISSL